MRQTFDSPIDAMIAALQATKATLDTEHPNMWCGYEAGKREIRCYPEWDSAAFQQVARAIEVCSELHVARTPARVKHDA